MAVLTGVNGGLTYQGAVIGSVRDWSLTINKDALDDTTLGAADRTFVAGVRSASGSATLLYDTDDVQTRQMLNTIMQDSGNQENIQFVFNTKDLSSINCNGFITNISHSVSVGAVQAATISFQVSGAVDGGF